MSDDVEQFVLKYQADVKEAEARLEQLNQKINKTEGATKKGTQAFKDFASDAGDEIGKLVPGIDKVGAAVRLMSAEFVAASAAIGVLAIGVKSVIDLRNQYGQQRLAGMESGISGLRLEDYQRKFSTNSQGNVSRDQALEQIRSLAAKFNGAYTDPSRMGTEAKQMRLLGVDVAPVGSGPRSFNDMFTQLSTNFSKMKPDQVQGIAKAVGIMPDFALAMAKLGPSVGRVTELTEADVRNRQSAEESVRKFNTQMNDLTNATNNAEIAIGTLLIPAFVRLLGWVTKIAEAIPKDPVSTAKEAIKNQGNFLLGREKSTGGFFSEWLRHPIMGGGPLGAAYRAIFKKGAPDKNPDQSYDTVVDGKIVRGGISLSSSKASEQSQVNKDKSNVDQAKTELASKGKSLEASIDRMVDAADKNNAMGAQSASDMQLAVNMFNGAVSTFSNAIDERQAWAAWAGEVGAAAGLQAPAGTQSANAPGTASDVYKRTAAAASQYDSAFSAAASKTGISTDVLKNMSRVESGGNANAVSSAGAIGLMQVMPKNGKALGLDLKDPAQNIMAGAMVLQNFLRIAHGDMRKALTMYHGGTDEANWGPLTKAYAGKVFGDAGGSSYNGRAGGGQNRNDLRMQAVRENLASRLGVPVKQLTFGGVNRDDVDFTLKQKEAEVSNNIFNLRNELQNPVLTGQNRAKIMQELRLQESGLQQLQTYGPQIVQDQQQGERSITIGERAVVINVNGAQDPNQTANIMEHRLQSTLGNIVNQASSGQKL